MIKDWSIGTKLIVSFLGLAIICAVVAGIGYYGMSKIMANADEIDQVTTPSVEAILGMQYDVESIKAQERGMYVAGTDAAEWKHLEDKVKSLFADFDKQAAKYEALPASAEEKAAWDELKTTHVPEFKAQHDKFVTLAKAGKMKEAIALNREALRDAVTEIDTNLSSLQKINTGQATELSAQADAAQQTSVTTLIGAAIVAFILSIALGILVTRSITRPIDRVIEGLTAGSEQVTSASNQVASASQQLAEGASEQAASLEETSSSLEEMAGMTRQNADNSKQADGMAREAQAAAQRGVGSVGEMSQAINRIKDSADSTAKILKTIDEIAFQTNLLALNAAVEAARAGEAGRGFAVVAEEVRALAQRSGEAAKTTAALIEDSQASAAQGVTASGEVAETLEQIAGSITRVAMLVSETAAASQEQAQGIEQVNTAVAQMDRVTQANAANAEESASASEELSAQAREVNEMIAVLIKTVRGARADVSSLTRSRASGNGERVSAQVHRMTANARHRSAQAAHHAAPVSPEEVIPLDDEDLADF